MYTKEKCYELYADMQREYKLYKRTKSLEHRNLILNDILQLLDNQTPNPWAKYKEAPKHDEG